MSDKKNKKVKVVCKVWDDEGCPLHEDTTWCCGHCPEGCP